MTQKMIEMSCEGIVYEKRARFLSLVFETVPAYLPQGEWKLLKKENEIIYERMRRAVDCLTAPNIPLPPWFRPIVIPSALIHCNEEEFKKVPNVDVILSATMPKMPQSNDWYGLHGNVCPGNILSELLDTECGNEMNSVQLETVSQALKKCLSLIQGPPGTGKTFTSAHLMKLWRRMYPNRGPVLATAQSNIAVDQMLSGCVHQRLNAVRIGQPVRVTEELQERTLDALIQKHPLYHKVELIKQEIDALHRFTPSTGREKGLKHRDLSILNDKLNAPKEKIIDEIIKAADVICATCVGSASDPISKKTFAMIVLDEASQCSEPEALIPLVKATTNASIVMIGDHQQLPPTMISQDPDSQRILGTSLFHRLVGLKEFIQKEAGQYVTDMSSAMETMKFNEGRMRQWAPSLQPFFAPITMTMLREQYRMHPILSEWPSWRFYHGKLQNAPAVLQNHPPKGFPWPQSTPGNVLSPLLFIRSAPNAEMILTGTQSKFNLHQAKIVVSVVGKLLSSSTGLTQNSIGIISPYTAQVQCIIQRLTKAGFKTMKSRSVDEDDASGDFLEVKTVDGYQGREKDVIIFSTVRSNLESRVGFLDDYRRLNVALTRAKRGLVVIGDPNTLSRDPTWSLWLDFIDTYRYYIDR